MVGTGISPSDRQSSAHRSVDDPQDPAAEWPAIPSEDGGGVADGLPPGDTQYSAHQSGGDPQDIAPERPGIPRDDDGTIADGRPPTDAQYPAHRSADNPQDAAAEGPTIPDDDGTVVGGRPSGDTQYPAHQSGGNTQDTAAERPTIPGDDDGTVVDGRPPGDTQYPAHQSGINPPDTGRPTILGDAGTVPDAMQPSDGGAHIITTPNHGLRLPQTQLLDPLVLRYAERPLGPGDCKLHSFPGKYKKCGSTVQETHLMLRVMSGAFCERCCPACHPGA